MGAGDAENVFSDGQGNDVFRWDLEGYDKSYICDLLDGFLDGAGGHGRKLVEIRMREVLFDKLKIMQTTPKILYKNVPVKICDTGFDNTLEVVLAPIN